MNKNIKSDQNGFASLVIALIMIIVLALITVGFAQLARREQQSALDKQLATQAQDAAETGINDAYKDITSNPPRITEANADSNQCMAPNAVPGGYTSNPDISQSREVRYTCLLVDMTPPDLEFKGVSPANEEALTFRTIGAAAATTTAFTITWASTNGTSVAPAIDQGFLPDDNSPTSWNAHNYPAVIQVSLTPYDSAAISRSSLISNSFTAYLYPLRGGISFYDKNSGNGPRIMTNCNNKGSCAATIAGFSSDHYVMQIVDYYVTSDIVVSASDSANNQLSFGDGQASIDVTGQAKNVLKRLRVRVPIKPIPNLPAFTVEGQNMCKRINTLPAPDTTSFVAPDMTSINNFPECYPQQP